MEKENLIKNISIILPIHELNGETEEQLFSNALTSVSKQVNLPGELIIVVPKGSEVETYMNGYDFSDMGLNVTIASNDGKSDFCSQINYGVSVTKTEWFSILEFDDEYSTNWFTDVNTYMHAHDDVDIFMPIIVDVDQDSNFIGLTNEAAWANSFSDELGYLDNNALLSFQNFNIDGVVMKKELFDDNGGFKSNIKLTFVYEFLLRMTFKDSRVMIIPRFGYKHMNQRDGSLFHSYKGEMNPVESSWWLAQAKKEYYFPNEREITYDENQ